MFAWDHGFSGQRPDTTGGGVGRFSGFLSSDAPRGALFCAEDGISTFCGRPVGLSLVADSLNARLALVPLHLIGG